MQDGGQPVRQFRGLGHSVGNVRVADLGLGAHESLGHRLLGHQERSCDFGYLETAEKSERERDLRCLSERGMTTREDQPQAVVGERAHVGLRAVVDG